jgi:hypothetical protein
MRKHIVKEKDIIEEGKKFDTFDKEFNKSMNWKEDKGKVLVILEENYDHNTEMFDGVKASSEIVDFIQSLLDKQKQEICTEIASYSPISAEHTKELIKIIKSLK